MPTNYTPEQRADLLGTLRLGRNNAINAENLARSLGYPTSGNQVKLRGLIKECIEQDGDLIGASTGRPGGFFRIATIQELNKYVVTLENRMRSDNDRRTALINSWNRVYPNNRTDVQLLNIEINNG